MGYFWQAIANSLVYGPIEVLFVVMPVAFEGLYVDM